MYMKLLRTLAERFSQAEMSLSLMRICYILHLQKDTA